MALVPVEIKFVIEVPKVYTPGVPTTGKVALFKTKVLEVLPIANEALLAVEPEKAKFPFIVSVPVPIFKRASGVAPTEPPAMVTAVPATVPVTTLQAPALISILANPVLEVVLLPVIVIVPAPDTVKVPLPEVAHAIFSIEATAPVGAAIEIEPTVKLPAPVLVPKVTVDATALEFELKDKDPESVNVYPSLIINPLATVGEAIVMPATVPLPVTVRVMPEFIWIESVVAGLYPVPPLQPLHVAVPAVPAAAPAAPVQVPVVIVHTESEAICQLRVSSKETFPFASVSSAGPRI
jgi:hypothetical protein